MAYIQAGDMDKASREYGRKVLGLRGYQGGWLYREGASRPWAQGWYSVWSSHRAALLDYYTATLTGFGSFRSLLETSGNYRPTILFDPANPKHWRYRLLADAYDEAQGQRGDPRRAYRGVRVRGI
jgi:hypothetical protein